MHILITGATGGIGQELALRFTAEKNFIVHLVARDEEKVEALKQKLVSLGRTNFHFYILDFFNIIETQLVNLFSPITHIDILINNAGTLINKPFIETDMHAWRSVFEVNLFSTAVIIKALHTQLKKSKQASIINIGSMGGFQGSSKFPGLAAYSASKAALANLSECLAEELKADKIHVNCLALGSVNTEMLHNAFPNYHTDVQASTIADFIFDFALKGSRLINGKVIPVSVSTP